MVIVMIKPLKHNETQFFEVLILFFNNHPCYDGTLPSRVLFYM